jgi:rhodanese-related sulfurtransferase
MTGPRFLPVALVAALAPGACGCLGTGVRSFDARCREMRAPVAREMLRDSREIPILDVRTSWIGRLAGAIVIPLAELPGRVRELDRHRSLPLVVVGDDAPAARQACEFLAGAGFRYVIFVPEGAEGLLVGVRGGTDVEGSGGERRP